jgi:excisionase family DNA binding protein
MTKEQSEYMKVSEVARKFGQTQRWVYRLIQDGKLPAIKPGKLYLVHRTDVEAFERQFRLGGSPAREEQPKESCTVCRRLKTPDEIADRCDDSACDLPICTECWADGFRYCGAHQPARAAASAGELGEPVAGEGLRAADARLREINLVNRIQIGLENFARISHPQTEEAIVIENWSALKQSSDQSGEVMQLKGARFLTKDMMNALPMNESLRYRIPPARGQEGGPLVIHVQVLSHLARMVRLGFDPEPFSRDELSEQLLRFVETTENEDVTYLVLLAASTGWSTGARELITGSSREYAFVHRQARFYLYDMQTGEILFNTQDALSRDYAALFSPILPEEQLEDIIDALERHLADWAFDHISLDEAVEKFPEFPERLLRTAFDRLAERRGLSLETISGRPTLVLG